MKTHKSHANQVFSEWIAVADAGTLLNALVVGSRWIMDGL